MLSPEQLNQIRIERCLHLGKNTAASKVGERTEAFRNFAGLENLSKLEDALVNYWAVAGVGDNYEMGLEFCAALFKAKTHMDRANVFCDLINVAYTDARFCEVVIESLKQSM
jgi:hypothetical protein